MLVLSPAHYGLKGVIEEGKDEKTSNVKINKEEEMRKIRDFNFAGEIIRKTKIKTKFMSAMEVAKYAKCHVSTVN